MMSEFDGASHGDLCAGRPSASQKPALPVGAASYSAMPRWLERRALASLAEHLIDEVGGRGER